MIAEICGLLAGLGLLSWWDIKKRMIPLPVLIGTGIYIIIMHVIFQRLSLLEMGAGAAIGLALLLLSFLAKGKVGPGDGLLFALIIGPALGFRGAVTVLWISLFFVTGAGAVMSVRRKGSGTGGPIEVPFVPFVLAALLLTLFLRGGAL
ncbi:MAG: prepilin peptidase [Lachnospiraceae bacterium]|nr:prepilin peptidase [Lachnospiraceae bacterium]